MKRENPREPYYIDCRNEAAAEDPIQMRILPICGEFVELRGTSRNGLERQKAPIRKASNKLNWAIPEYFEGTDVCGTRGQLALNLFGSLRSLGADDRQTEPYR